MVEDEPEPVVRERFECFSLIQKKKKKEVVKKVK